MSSMLRSSLLSTLALLALVLCAACGGDSTYEIEEVRERPATKRPAPAVSADVRFGAVQGASSADNPHAGMGLDAQGRPVGEPARPQVRWAWETPEGWKELPERPMREASWQVEGHPETDCGFTLLPGQAGGLVANVNRWREQMGLEPQSPDEIEDLPQRAFLGGPGTFVDIEGRYGGMGGDTDLPQARLLGLILALPQVTAFLKMTGPADVLAEEREAFLALADSLEPVRVPPAGHGAAGAPAEGAGPPDAPDGGGERLGWTAPPGWERQPPRMMREVTYRPQGATLTECYVTILAGDGGGLADNLNRWRDQMGQPPLDDAAIAALPRLEVLGQEGVMIKVLGSFTGQGGEQVEDAALLGLVVMRPGDSVFVKMTGPAPEVLAEEESFVAFCESLRP